MKEKGPTPTVEELQQTVAALEKRVNDLALKSQITASQMIGKSGLDRFFGEREFWENIIDVGDSSCHQRCIDALQSELAGIAANTTYTDMQRAAARDKAYESVSACHNHCDERFPTPIGP